MLIRRIGLAWCLLAATFAGSGRACEVERRASVQLAWASGLLATDVAVNGRTERFIVDTGAERTMVSEAAVKRLGLRRDPWVSTAVQGVGGIERQANVLLDDFTLSGVALRRRSLAPVLSLVVAPIPWLDRIEPPVIGLLGADYLSVFDLELDVAGESLVLHGARDCTAGEIPWPVPHAAVPLRRPRPFVTLVPVWLDGTRLEAQLDTGATTSLISRRGAARLGLAPASGADAQALGLGRAPLPLRSRRFAELRFGPFVMRDVTIPSGAPAGGYSFDMILGLDVLREARLWISYAAGAVLVADVNPRENGRTPAADEGRRR